jgi:hypothetical protein
LRYQITQTGWSIGAVFVPNGAVIDTVAGTDDWSKLAQGLSPPLNAQPLDQAAWAAMKSLYPDLVGWIVTGPGVVRS